MWYMGISRFVLKFFLGGGGGWGTRARCTRKNIGTQSNKNESEDINRARKIKYYEEDYRS